MPSHINQTTARRSVSEIVAHNSDPKNGVSLCIPRVFNNIGWKRVKRHMIEANLGFVEAVHLIPRGQYKRAYVHFRANSWNMRDPVARQALTALQNGQKILIEYDEPWYWEVSISRSERRAEAPKPKERKVQIRLASSPSACEPPVNEVTGQLHRNRDLNDPIVAPRAMENLRQDHSVGRAMEELRQERREIVTAAYDTSLQCDEEMREENPAAALAAGFDFEDGEVVERDVPPPLVRQTNENCDI